MLSWSCGSPLRMARWTSRSSTLNFYWQSKIYIYIYITYKRASVKNLGNHEVLEEKECNLSIKTEPKSRKATPYLLPLLTLQKARRNELYGCGNRHRMKTAQTISKMQRKKEEAEEKMRRMKKHNKVCFFKYRQENLGDSLYCRLPAEYHSLRRFPGWPPGQQWRHPDHWVKGTGSLVSLSWTTHAPWATENKIHFISIHAKEDANRNGIQLTLCMDKPNVWFENTKKYRRRMQLTLCTDKPNVWFENTKQKSHIRY